MKMKSVPLTLLAISILAGIMLTPSHASFIVNTYARTDRASYVPGDSGTLLITIRNSGTQAFTVKNISITYPWKAFITDHWDGNFTTTGITQALAAGQTYNTQYTFTVPTDGRASNIFGGTISIQVGTDIGGGSYSSAWHRCCHACTGLHGNRETLQEVNSPCHQVGKPLFFVKLFVQCLAEPPLGPVAQHGQ